MKFLGTRNIKYKKLYFQTEILYLILKYIIFNEKFSLKMRLKASLFLSKNKNMLIKFRRRCFLTSRGRGILRFAQLSRIMFREKANFNLLPFLKKTSW